MDNQHRKISGYRELTQEEVDLMNEIKAQGAVLMDLQSKLALKIETRKLALIDLTAHDPSPENVDEYERFLAAEPSRWASIGKTDIQTGISALVRAVAQPGGAV